MVAMQAINRAAPTPAFMLPLFGTGVLARDVGQRAHPVLGPPIDVRHRFATERAHLLDALSGLDAVDWSSATPCPGWTVHDLAAHVLGDDVGRLARTRDAHTGPGPTGVEDLPRFIDRINEEWLVAARRMSPRFVVSALAWTGAQIAWADADVVTPGRGPRPPVGVRGRCRPTRRG